MKSMNKIPMQVYFDPETAQFYKDYAKSVGKSFAQVIREITQEKKKEIQTKKAAKGLEKKAKIHPLLKALEEIKLERKNSRDHYPDKTDDDLLYGED